MTFTPSNTPIAQQAQRTYNKKTLFLAGFVFGILAFAGLGPTSPEDFSAVSKITADDASKITGGGATGTVVSLPDVQKFGGLWPILLIPVLAPVVIASATIAVAAISTAVAIPVVATAAGATTVAAGAAIAVGGTGAAIWAVHSAKKNKNPIAELDGVFPNGKFGLVGGKDGKFCADETHRNICNRDELQVGWEGYKIEQNGDRYALIGGKDNKYCADEGHDGVKCDRGSVGGWERFELKILDKSKGTVAFKGGKDNKWCADEGDVIRCNRNDIGGWETFTVIDATPVDCHGEFGVWGDCSKACLGGEKKRIYSVIAAAMRGGAECPHTHGFIESATCNPQKCSHAGLTRSLWIDQNGKAGLWHDDNGHLNHIQPGATAKNDDGSYKIQPTTPDDAPSLQCTLADAFDSPVDTVADGGEMVNGYFTPPSDGLYQFCLAADDGGILYFGETEATKSKIASINGFVGTPAPGSSDSSQASTQKYWSQRQRESGSVSDPITLVGGQKYYIAAFEVNRQGRDALSVAAKGGGWNADEPIPATFEGQDVLTHVSAADEALPPCPKKLCETVQVGAGPRVGEIITLGNAALKCPQTISKENWLNPEKYSDTFKIDQTGNKFTIVRTDTGNEADGWGMDLEFKCC